MLWAVGVTLALQFALLASRIITRGGRAMSTILPGTDPSKCVLDAFRISIAKRLSEALPPLTIEQAYSGVDYGKKGVDFTVALPRFRLPGKVDELAKRVVSSVSRSHPLRIAI
jgi:hypothetical protein